MVTIKLQRKWGASSMKQHAGACSSVQQQHQAALPGRQHAAAEAVAPPSTRQQHQAGSKQAAVGRF